jgi:hypothetical protein
VVEGDATFVRCKGFKESVTCTFGITGITLFPDAKINHEFSLAPSRSKSLVELFGSGRPPQRLSVPPGYVTDFVFKRPFRRLEFLPGVLRAQRILLNGINVIPPVQLSC